MQPIFQMEEMAPVSREAIGREPWRTRGDRLHDGRLGS